MRLIDADKLKKQLYDNIKCLNLLIKKEDDEQSKNYLKDEKEVFKVIADVILDGIPTIDAEAVRHGKWIWIEDELLKDGQDECDREAWYQCSECDAYDLRLKDSHADYCWSCGCKMDLDEVNDED